MVAMVVIAFITTISLARRGTVPFFFTPLHFLIFDPMTILTFAGLTTAAVMMRRQTDWHRRLHYCAMALLLEPAVGRLLPMPLLIPYAFEATIVTIMIFPAVAIIAEWRRQGAIHPAWKWGIGAIVGSALLINMITYGPLGPPIYRAVTDGSPGASVPPLEFPAPPTGPLRTGRPASI